MKKHTEQFFIGLTSLYYCQKDENLIVVSLLWTHVEQSNTNGLDFFHFDQLLKHEKTTFMFSTITAGEKQFFPKLSKMY